MEKWSVCHIRWTWVPDEFSLAREWHKRGHDWTRHIFSWGSGNYYVTLRLISFDHDFNRNMILCRLAAMGLRPATVKELAAFGHQNIVDFELPVAALGSEMKKFMDGPVDVPVLKGRFGKAKIVLCDRSGISGKKFLFLAAVHTPGLVADFIPDSECADETSIAKQIKSVRNSLRRKRGK